MTEYLPPGYSNQPIVTSTSAEVGDSGKKKGKKKGASGGAPTRRSTSTAKYLFIAFALLLGLLMALFLTSREQATYVVKVTSAVPALSSIQAGNLEAVPLAESAIEPNTFTGASGEEAIAAAVAYAQGKWLVWPMSVGQQLRTENFSSVGELGVPLAPDERLISVGAKAARSVAGAVRPGDRVDVYVSETTGLTGLLRENVEVVGVSITSEQFDSAAQAQIADPNLSLSGVVPAEPIPGTYVLRVKADEVAKFATADTAGKLFLALRGVDATTPVDGLVPADILEAICGEWFDTGACLRVGG